MEDEEFTALLEKLEQKQRDLVQAFEGPLADIEKLKSLGLQPASGLLVPVLKRMLAIRPLSQAEISELVPEARPIKQRAARICVICKTITNPPHDRRAHKEEAPTAWTEEESEQNGFPVVKKIR